MIVFKIVSITFSTMVAFLIVGGVVMSVIANLATN